MAPEMNYGLNKDDLGKDRRADARPIYGDATTRKPSKQVSAF